jgi:hypothetical protein
MTSLHELQSRMLDALLSDSADPAIALIDAPAAAAAARLGVYRNTVLRNVAAALHSTFPVIWRLVGEDYFRSVAHRFILQHPSTCGDLTPVGTRFPAYLTELHRHDQYAYLGDVARLELKIQEALLAGGHPPFDLERLAQVPPAEYDALRFVLHPALRLFASRYPARRIWQSHVGSDADPEGIELAGGGERLALLQHRLQLQFHPLTLGEWCWLDAVGRGEPFKASVETAAAHDGEFDATLALRRFVSVGAIVGF